MPPIINDAMLTAVSHGNAGPHVGRTDQPFGAGGMQGMDEHGRAGPLRSLEERLVTLASPIDTPLTLVPISTPRKSRLHQPLELGSARSESCSGTMPRPANGRFLTDHGRDCIVDVAADGLGILRFHPVRQQLRHGRQDLALDRARRHRLEAPLEAPALIGDRAEHLARDNHVAVMAVMRRRHGGPARIGVAASIGGEALRNDMGMDVRRAGHCGQRQLVQATCPLPAIVGR